jgi:F-type H+-transporting ATPase subunit gamma
LLVVTADKGLAGAFNANVLRQAENWIDAKRKENKEFTLLTVGKKAKDYFERRNIAIQDSFVKFGDYAHLDETLPVANAIIEGFVLGAWDEVQVVYTHFRTTLKQETALKSILPVTVQGIRDIVESIVPERGRYAQLQKEKKEGAAYAYEYKFEPSPEEILNALIPQLLRMHIHHMILESNASEHSARMVAMKSASDNAKEFIGELTLEFNKSRQAGITRELTEITAGREALEN